MPDVVLEHPWLWLLLIPLAALFTVMLRRSYSPLPRTRQIIGGTGLALAVAALTLAATNPTVERTGNDRTLWVLIDRSLSVGGGAEQRLEAVLQDLRGNLAPDDYVGVITFADSAQLVLPPTRASDLAPSLQLPVAIPGSETFARPAIDMAERLTAPGTACVILLIGDGYHSERRYGHILAAGLQGRDLRIYTMPVDSDPPPEAAIVDIRARLSGTDTTFLAVDADIHSTVPQMVALQVRVNNRDVSDGIRSDRLDNHGRASVLPGRSAIRFEIDVQEALPVYQLDVDMVPEQDTLADNNRARFVVHGPSSNRVLLVHGPDGPERALARALVLGGLEVTSGPPAIMPDSLAGLERYQSVVLCNVPLDGLSSQQERQLRDFVRRGGGLAKVGGPLGFGPGGYYQSVLESILPVTSDVVEEGRTQTTAIVVALDRSGSMGMRVGGMSKMELANEGCVRTIQLAPPGALFGMLSVDTRPEWIIPLSPLTDRRTAIARARSHQPGGGGIYVDIAAEYAFRALAEADADVRHLILFSDGDDTERQEGVEQATDLAYRQHGITTTVICLGDGRDVGFLRRMAAAGRGRFFFVDDPSHLPGVFTREAEMTSAGFIREDPFRPRTGTRDSLTDGVDFESDDAPPLLGYVGATAREEATVHLWADDARERPLLATWRYELGRVLAFTSDARDRWAEHWLDDDRFALLWQRWVRWTLPPEERIHGVESEWIHTTEGPLLTLSFFDEHGYRRQFEALTAQGTLPDGSAASLNARPAGAGTWQVQFPRSGAGMYQVAIADGDTRLVAREQRMFVPDEEFLKRPADTAALEGLARATGGALVATAHEPATSPVTGAIRRDSMRGLLLWLAVAGLFFGIGSRRLPSVWSRRNDDAESATTPEATAQDAMRRLQEKRRESSAPKPPAPRPSTAWGSGKMKPETETPAPESGQTEDDPEDIAESSLSALRKVRKQVKGND
jgi:Ca-activated chloride channel homolog